MDPSTVYIGCGAGFSGDRLDAAIPVVETLTKIPRPSTHEEKILQYLRNFAEERNLEMREDSTGNIVILRPGSGGGENAPTVIIQSHVDMVCEKNRDADHDFMKIPWTFTLKMGG